MSSISVLLMNQQLVTAFTFAKELAAQLITLSTAIIGFTVTFSKDFVAPTGGWSLLIVFTWTIFLLSIAFGILDIAALTRSLAPLDSVRAPSEIGFNVRIWAASQEISFGVGIIALIVYGVSALGRGNSN
jgi:magnesium-transporting ATPase (P-type)